jgi:hypothetical protein
MGEAGAWAARRKARKVHGGFDGRYAAFSGYGLVKEENLFIDGKRFFVSFFAIAS